jgi:hypothetical protein
MTNFISHYLKEFRSSDEIKDIILNEECYEITKELNPNKCNILFRDTINFKKYRSCSNKKTKKILNKIHKKELHDNNGIIILFPTVLCEFKINKNNFHMKNNIINLVINKYDSDRIVIWGDFPNHRYDSINHNYNLNDYLNVFMKYLVNSVKTLEIEYSFGCKINHLPNSLRILKKKNIGLCSDIENVIKLPLNIIFIETFDSCNCCDRKKINNILKINTFKTLIKFNIDYRFVNGKNINYAAEKHNGIINILEFDEPNTLNNSKIIKSYDKYNLFCADDNVLITMC